MSAGALLSSRSIWPLLFSTLVACGAEKSAARAKEEPPTPRSANKASRTGIAAPAWFSAPPKSPRSLYFVGDANGASDEASARELAVNKALAELTLYCGASIKSEGKSLERERNGHLEQVVSMTVDVAGDELTVKEAVVKHAVAGRGSDGTYDAYALLEWPKAQYDAVQTMQRDRGKHALELFLKARGRADELDVGGSKGLLKEARAILGPMKSTILLQNAEYKNTALLYEAMTALQDRLDGLDKERKQVFAVAVECLKDGKPATCNPSRAGALRQALSGSGRKVAVEAIPASTARDILSSENPSADKTVRSAGYVVAVRYTADLQAVEGPFTFIRYGARAVVYDTSTNRIICAYEVPLQKEGHPTFEGAMEKGFNIAEKAMLGWLGEQIPKVDARVSR